MHIQIIRPFMYTQSDCASSGSGIHVLPPVELCEIPEDFLKKSEKPGSVQRVPYKTPSVDHPGEIEDKYASIYIPFGYDSSKKYDILYFIHGGGGNADLFLKKGSDTLLKLVLDNLIASEKLRPMLVVTPTFYPMDNTDNSVPRSEKLVPLFPRELVENLAPAVESAWSTYASSVDRDGLAASRMHRAIGGFSMGSVTTWYAFAQALDCISVFIPISGDCWEEGQLGGGSKPTETARDLAELAERSGIAPEDFFVYAITGTEDIAYPNLKPQMDAMRKHGGIFHFAGCGAPENVRFQAKEHGIHNNEHAVEYLYNILPLIWGK